MYSYIYVNYNYYTPNNSRKHNYLNHRRAQTFLAGGAFLFYNLGTTMIGHLSCAQIQKKNTHIIVNAKYPITFINCFITFIIIFMRNIHLH